VQDCPGGCFDSASGEWDKACFSHEQSNYADTSSVEPNNHWLLNRLTKCLECLFILLGPISLKYGKSYGMLAHACACTNMQMHIFMRPDSARIHM